MLLIINDLDRLLKLVVDSKRPAFKLLPFQSLTSRFSFGRTDAICIASDSKRTQCKRVIQEYEIPSRPHRGEAKHKPLRLADRVQTNGLRHPERDGADVAWRRTKTPPHSVATGEGVRKYPASHWARGSPCHAETKGR